MSKASYWRGVDVALEEQRRAQQAIRDTWQWAQTGRPISEVEDRVRALSEYDDEYLDLLVQDLVWDYMGTQGTTAARERKWAVDGSRQAWRSQSPLAQWAIWTWTAWGLGDSVAISAEDEQNAQPVLDEFLSAARNAAVLGQDRLHRLSERTLIDGNAFLAFFASTVDGLCTVRTVSQDEIEIVCNPEDNQVPWFYKRTYTDASGTPRDLYYPDWALYFGGKDAPLTVEEAWERLRDNNLVSPAAQRADQAQSARLGGMEEEPATAVCMLHIAHNVKENDDAWGWPLLTVALPWLRTHKRFAQARFTVALSVAQFVRRSKVAGGSRAVASVIDTIASNLSQTQYTDTNPPAAAGSWHVENKAVDTSELPMRTGAGDAEADNKLFAWMVAIACGLNTVSIGLDASRWATAIQMDKVQSYLMTRYKTFWSAQFTRMARIVFSFAERFGGKSFSSMNVQVSVDSFSLPDFPDIVESESRMMAELTNSVAAGIIPADAAAAIQARMVETALQALGLSDAADLTSDEAFEIGDYEEEPTEMPEELARAIEVLAHRLQEQREPFVPAGATEPVLPVPVDVEITDQDIERALELFDQAMPELRGMLNTEEVMGQVYDGEQY